MFATKQQWDSHWQRDHSVKEYYKCMACIDNPVRYDEAAWRAHTLDAHAGYISEEAMQTVFEISRRRAPTELDSCPICDWPRSEGSQPPESAVAIMRSMIQYLQEMCPVDHPG